MFIDLIAKHFLSILCSLEPSMRHAFLLLKFFVAAAVIWALFAYGVLDLSAFRVAIAHPVALVTVLILLLLVYVLYAYRWRLLLACQSVDITGHAAVGVTFFSLFVGNFLPGGALTGDAVRIAYAVKAFSARKTAVVISVFADRLIGFYAMLLVCCTVALVDSTENLNRGPLRFLATTSGVLLSAASVSLFVIYIGLKHKSHWLQRLICRVPQGRVAHALQQIIEALSLYRRSPQSIILALAISVLAFSLIVICVMIVGHAMQLGPLESIDYGFAAPWAWLANYLPVTPGGIGVGEAAFDRICHWRESSPTAAAYGTIFLVYRIATIVATLPGLVIYFFHRDTFRLLIRLPNDG